MVWVCLALEVFRVSGDISPWNLTLCTPPDISDPTDMAAAMVTVHRVTWMSLLGRFLFLLRSYGVGFGLKE